MTRFNPLGDRVLVLPEPPPSESASGLIVIPYASQERPLIGIVAEVGPGNFIKGRLAEMTVKEADVVLYSKYAGSEIVLDGIKLLIMHEVAILGIIQNGEATETPGG